MCGIYDYSARYYKCCASTVVPYAEGETQCCYDKVYNPATHICCGSEETATIHDINDGDQCCGPDYIDTTQYTCCNKVKHPGNQCETRCCGETPYDSRKYDCCDAETGEITDRLNKFEGEYQLRTN